MGGSGLGSRLLEWGRAHGGKASLRPPGMPVRLHISLAQSMRLGHGGHKATKVKGFEALLETRKYSSFVSFASFSL